MENEMLMYFCWFLGGAIAHKILSYLLTIGTSINIFNQTLSGCLIMLERIDQQKVLLMSNRHNKLRRDGTGDEEIEKIKSEDIQAHHMWREMMIGVIRTCCPVSIQGTLRFKDWATAMDLLK